MIIRLVSRNGSLQQSGMMLFARLMEVNGLVTHGTNHPYLPLIEKQDTEKYEVELKSVEKRLTELESQFLTHLDGLLKRKVLTEQEFARANEIARNQKTDLAARKEELSRLLSQARASEDLIKKIPTAIKTIEEAIYSLETRQQKAQLQTILKAAHIYKDGKIELEFRG